MQGERILRKMFGLMNESEVIVYMTHNFAITQLDDKYIVYTPDSIFLTDNELFDRAIKMLGIDQYETREVNDGY